MSSTPDNSTKLCITANWMSPQEHPIYQKTHGCNRKVVCKHNRDCDHERRKHKDITSVITGEASLQESLNTSTAKNDARFDQLWEKIGDQAEQNARVAETVQKIDTFFIDKYLRKKYVEYEVNPSTEGSSGAKVPTMKPVRTIVVKVVPPNGEGEGGNQFVKVVPVVQAGAQLLAANVVA
ncbi:hypothetical protein ACLB2K_030536 [Fragaria x ananassa]